ncbi:MAG: histidine--tRNA ligase [Candidatus Aenigmatarchaeota archaeon]
MFQPPKGTRDFLPDDMEKRRFVFELLREVFEKYGYGEVETPAFESLELLTCKGSLGDEAVKDVYKFEDKSERRLGLRFDFTVPIARIVAAQKLAKPVRWYCIGKSWRYEETTKSRYREFSQAGIELIGSALPEADAEILQMVIDCLLSLGLTDFIVRVNSREILDEMADNFGIKNKEEVFRIIDKIEKKGELEVRSELKKILNKKQIDEVIEFIKSNPNESDMKNLKELKEIINLLDEKYRKFVKIDFSIARGLDYYTGMIFEINVDGSKDAIAAGGRYDNLIKKYGGEETPATGFGIGVERLIPILEKNNLIKADEKNKFFVIPVSNNLRRDAIDICNMLRNKNIAAILSLGKSISKQLDYANAKKMQYVIIIGEKELKEESVKLRDMKTGKEKNIKIQDLVKEVWSLK